MPSRKPSATSSSSSSLSFASVFQIAVSANTSRNQRRRASARASLLSKRLRLLPNSLAAHHFVADGQLALHGDIDLDQLDHARRQLVALLELFLALFGDLAKHVD